MGGGVLGNALSVLGGVRGARRDAAERGEVAVPARAATQQRGQRSRHDEGTSASTVCAGTARAGTARDAARVHDEPRELYMTPHNAHAHAPTHTYV
jgi:hypothetical protein